VPASKNYLTYPEAFHDLIRVAVTKPIKIPNANGPAANKLRGHIYGFIGALKKAAHEKDTPQEIRELYNMSTKVKLTVDGENFLIAFPRDQDPVAMAITQALREQSDIPLPATDAFKPSDDLTAFAVEAQKARNRE
jgi:hypothetical protein